MSTLRTIAMAAVIVGLSACGGHKNSNADTSAPTPVATSTTPTGSRGALQSVTDIAVVTKSDSDAAASAANVAALAGPAMCDVRVQSIVHATIGTRGEVARNSAALLTPRGVGCNGPFPLVAYARATSKDRSRTLADPADRETSLLINFFAARGYIVVATDYLGYGQSDYAYHPYLHAASEASSVIDSIRAARAALASAAVSTSGKVFLAGYSQGGQAILGTEREIERTAGAEITVTATGAMSGPYDLALTFVNASATLLPSIPDENPSASDRARILLADTLVDVAGFFADLAPIRSLFARDSVIDFTPRAPVLLCGGARDLTVPFVNSTGAATAFTARGARVTLVDIEQEPGFAAYRPPVGAPDLALSSYHNRIVPPLCVQVVRDRLFEALR